MGPVFDVTRQWLVAAGHREVVDVLAEPLAYPRWWPQCRSAHPGGPTGPDGREGHDSVVLEVRSALPYTLRLALTRAHEDRAGGLLAVRIHGDLRGWAVMRVRPEGTSTRVLYRQRVIVAAPGIARWARPAAPVLRANHAWMMRAGERGLRRWLAHIER